MGLEPTPSGVTGLVLAFLTVFINLLFNPFIPLKINVGAAFFYS